MSCAMVGIHLRSKPAEESAYLLRIHFLWNVFGICSGLTFAILREHSGLVEILMQ